MMTISILKQQNKIKTVVTHQEQEKLIAQNFAGLDQWDEVDWFFLDPYAKGHQPVFEYSGTKLNLCSSRDFPLYFVWCAVNWWMINTNHYNFLTPNSPSKQFLILCNKPREFRCEAMDWWAKQGTLARAHYSWLHPSEHYQFSHFDNRVCVLDRAPQPDCNLSPLPHIQTHDDSHWHSDSQWDVILSSSGEFDHPYIDEKIVIPLMAKRPFTFYAPESKTHSWMTALGFDLYNQLEHTSVTSWAESVDQIQLPLDWQFRATQNRQLCVKLVQHQLIDLNTPAEALHLRIWEQSCREHRVPNLLSKLWKR